MLEKIRNRKKIKKKYLDDDIDTILEGTDSPSKKDKKKLKRYIENNNEMIYDMIDEKEKKGIKKKLLIILIKLLLVLIIILFILFLISMVSWSKMAHEMIRNTSSVVVDTNGTKIAEIGIERNRKNISINEMPDNLKNAYISIEDQRYYKHFGVDVKRTGAATINYITSFGKASFGGSTITQQLVKNMTGNNNAKISRKFDEWTRAIVLECTMSKEEILEAYLNIIYVGPNIYGVESGAEYYFSKSAKKLSLVECAYLAGINNSPNSYNPFREDENNDERIKKRTKIVLSKMKELGYISSSEYEDAKNTVEKGLKFKRGDIDIRKNKKVYSYHTDAIIQELIKDISKKKHITETFASNYLYMSGLKVYSTQNSEVQKVLEEEFEKKKYILKSSNNNDSTSEAAMVIIDHKTGQVVGCVGALGKKTSFREFNRATQAKRQTGSAIKPIAILAPAIEKKIITASTIFNDKETVFDDGSDGGYRPKNYDDYMGDITVRQAIESSQNIPFVKMMEKLTPKTSIKYLEKMGISTLTDKDENLSLALGGLSSGMTPLEVAAAYSTIANDGVYIKPVFYTKIENTNGKIILKVKQKKRKVISKQTSYIVKSLLTEPVKGNNGTATYCSIDGMSVCAKTGTTNENYDRWLCGFTPYYTAATWYGYDKGETIEFNNRNPAGLLWSSVMKKIHKNFPDKTFEKPHGIESCTICTKTGKKANNYCINTYTEYYLKGTDPRKL